MDFNQFGSKEQNQLYITAMRPVLNKKALFSDTTEDYVTPAEPSPYDLVTIRFRAAKIILTVFFLSVEVKDFS